MNKLKFGLVGCGRISERHFEALSQIQEAHLIACCDILEERAIQSAEKYHIPNFYTDYLQMLDEEPLDAILICTPSGMHPEMGCEAARKGIHVISEKPIGISLASADNLIRTCDNNKVKLFVVKQNRLNLPIQLLKRAIDKGRFGRLFSANATVRWTRPQSYYDVANWRGTWKYDGGAFLNQSSHYFDLLQWLVGPVKSVFSYTSTVNHSIEVEDQGCGVMEFNNGVIASIEVSMNTYPRNMEGSITIMGEKGFVKIGGVAVNKVETWEFLKYDDDDRLLQDNNHYFNYPAGHYGYLLNVIDVLKNRAKPNTDGREARRSLEIILAMYQSAKMGMKVTLPLNESEV